MRLHVPTEQKIHFKTHQANRHWKPTQILSLLARWTDINGQSWIHYESFLRISCGPSGLGLLGAASYCHSFRKLKKWNPESCGWLTFHKESIRSDWQETKNPLMIQSLAFNTPVSGRRLRLTQEFDNLKNSPAMTVWFIRNSIVFQKVRAGRHTCLFWISLHSHFPAFKGL